MKKGRVLCVFTGSNGATRRARSARRGIETRADGKSEFRRVNTAIGQGARRQKYATSPARHGGQSGARDVAVWCRGLRLDAKGGSRNETLRRLWTAHFSIRLSCAKKVLCAKWGEGGTEALHYVVKCT